jgi:hypothetical protein
MNVADHTQCPTSPSLGEVAAKRPEGVFALPAKEKPREALSENAAGLTPSVALRATAPPLRGGGPPVRQRRSVNI